MRLVLGIDGGGTRTRAALVDERGEVLGQGQGGPANVSRAGAERVRASLSEAAAAAGARPGSLSALHLGLAGAGSARARDTALEIARALGLAPPERVAVDTDLSVALEGALGGAPGIVLVAGTGSACLGRGADGTLRRAGGWGRAVDDAGSAADLGRRALAAVARAIDGRGPSTALRAALVARAGGADQGGADADTARLAPLVTRAAGRGDAVARAIVARAADELARLVEAVARALDWGAGELPVATIGGVARDATFAPALRAAVARRVPRARVLEPRTSPERGAALFALRSIGVETGAELVGRLADSGRARP